MVALLKDDGRFEPKPVVKDNEKLKQLVDAMEKAPKAPAGLVEAIRVARRKYKITAK